MDPSSVDATQALALEPFQAAAAAAAVAAAPKAAAAMFPGNARDSGCG